jgi:hypothetical protein
VAEQAKRFTDKPENRRKIEQLRAHLTKKHR